MYLLATPYIVQFNIINIYREKKTIQKYQCNCSDGYIFLTNLGDYLVYLSKYRIKGHYARPSSVLEQAVYKCPKH